MITIAAINQKGGVGKTTTAVNLAVGLARKGHRTLLVDLDPQAHATNLLRGQEKLGPTVADLFSRKTPSLKSVIRGTTTKGLDLAPSEKALLAASESAYASMFRESILKKAMEGLAYDYVLLDCPPSLGLLSTNALLACDRIVVPCQMSMPSLDGLADLWDTVGEVKSGDRTKFLRILLTMYDSRTTLTNAAVMEQLAPHGSLLFGTRIRRNEPLNQAYLERKCVFDFQEDCMGADDYRALTEEVRKLWRN